MPIPAQARLADDADWVAEPVDLSRVGNPSKRFSWLSPRTLWRSRNNVLAALSGDPTEHARAAWVAERHATLTAAGASAPVAEDFTIERADLGDFAFMVMGDCGEGDRSQYSVVPALLSVAQDSEFAVIASDVVYPAGDANEYVEKFFVPYAGYPKPIYAVPGNHDWLDGLVGFMRHFCGAEPPARKFRPPRRARWARSALALHAILWRRPRALKQSTIDRAAELRGAAQAAGPAQPNMYFCIDTPQLRIVCIDVGILGRLDAEQGRWLERVSSGDKPKLLISGKPVYAGPDMSPRRILDVDGTGASDMLWNVVRDPDNNYVAMVSGDVHHYERHAVRLPGGRTMQCIISGGGGAFMTSTHQIPRIDRPDVDESSWVVYPTRADSLRAYSIVLLRRLRGWLPWRPRRPLRGIPADEAAAIVAGRQGLDLAAELTRGEGAGQAETIRVSMRSRLLTHMIFPWREWFPPAHVSEALDWDDPPFFKNFLRLELAAGRLTVNAYGVTGLQRDARQPAVIDRVEIDLRPGSSDGGV